MADRVTIVCADGLRINYSTEYYKTLSDVSQLGNEVPIQFDGDLVSRVISYRRGYVPSVGEALQALEVLHYLQADSKIIARWTHRMPSECWSKLPDHILHMIYTTEGSLTVSTEVQRLLSKVIAVCGSEAISYHAAMLLKWQATNTSEYCDNHMMVDKNNKQGWSTECDGSEMCRYRGFSLVKYLDGLDSRYAGLNVVSHTYDEWLAADKDIKPVLQRVLSQSSIIELRSSILILTRVCEVACRTCDMDLVKSIKTSKIIVERYGSPYYIDMRRLLKCCLDRVMHRILECCLDSVTGPLHDDLLTQEDHHISVKLKDKLVELVGEGAMKMLQRRYEPDPVIAAAEQVVGTKMIDLLFCYFVFHAE